MRRVAIVSTLILCVALVAPLGAAEGEGVIIQCQKPYDSVVTAVRAMGGTVTHQYENIGAIAAEVPGDRFDDLMALSGIDAVYKDVVVPAPDPSESVAIAASEIAGVVSGDDLAEPLDYLFDNDMTGASVLHGGGIFGSGVIVAIIDSGTANNPAVVPSIAGAVIGGENYVPGATEPGATSTLNYSHGTWVGSTIAAYVGFVFSSSSTIAQSVATHAPGSSIPFGGGDMIPMVGSAPGASLYALKVFPASGAGAPESRIIAAMDRATTLKRNFNDGVPSLPVAGDGSEEDPFVFDSLNIQVVNMSLGGPTLFAGRDLEDQLTQVMVDEGMVLVASAGNDGHTAMTVGSPGTGMGSLTVAASSTAAHERILRDLQYGLGIGSFYRPSDHVQAATFSSRGPNADGRTGPNVTANGFANYAQGASGGISVVSGTSFSAPTVAGAAALLIEAQPSATAAEIREALIATADPAVHGDDSGAIDQGAGFIDIPAALGYLGTPGGGSGDDADSEEKVKKLKKVKKNLEKGGFEPVKFRKVDGIYTFSTHVADLAPGEVAQFFVESKKDTSQIVVSFENIDPDLPPSGQNVFFGDDLFVEVADAPTSFDDLLLANAFVPFDDTFTFDNPQTGIIRVAVMGDWTNAGDISTDLVIQRIKAKQAKKVKSGKVEQGGLDVVGVEIPVGTTEATFELSWKNHWGAYPTDDLDMLLVDPSSSWLFDGATLASPERVVIGAPAPGTWYVLVDGFTVHGINKGPESKWELRVYDQDGKSLK